MQESNLNLFDLRKRRLPPTPSLVDGLKNILSPLQHAKVSRRTLLKMMGTALPAPAVMSFAEGRFRTFQISREGGRISFIVGGIDRWTLDPIRFSGRPEVAFDRQKEKIKVQLSNALFPGTNISADLSCELNKQSGTWLMNLKTVFGNFSASCDFVDWLQGAAKAANKVTIDGLVGTNSDAFWARLHGNAFGEFQPNWTWLLRGENLASAQAFDQQITSDRAVVHLPHEDDSHLLAEKPSRRTVVGLDRGSRLWSLKPSQTGVSRDDWSLSDLDDLFDRLIFETAQNDSGETVSAVAADSPARITEAKFLPSTELFTEHGSQFAITLRNTLLAARSTPAGVEAAFIADYASETSRVFGPAYTVSLKTSNRAAPFELVTVNDELKNLQFDPELLEIHAPVQGAITEPCQPVTSIADLELPASEHSSRQWWRVVFWPPNWGKGPKCLKMDLLTIQVIRPEDLLVLWYSFENLELIKGKDDIPRLVVPENAPGPGRIKINFPPQSITERAFYEVNKNMPLRLPDGTCMPQKKDGETAKCDPDADKSEEKPTEPPVPARMSGDSQLVFELPKDQYLDYTIEGLLDWSKLVPVLVSYADKPEKEGVFKSTDITDPRKGENQPQDFTALETPYRLFLSPNKYSAWKHKTTPAVAQQNRTELWHTRLAVKADPASPTMGDEIDEESTELRSVRAIWSPDYEYDENACKECSAEDDNVPFRMSMNRCDRHQIVRLTSDYAIDEIERCPNDLPLITKQPHTAPVQVNRLMLSSLGAFMDTRGNWEPPKFMTLEEWVHRSTMARDHYVKVVYKGYLFPLGHRASLIKVTERKFELQDGSYVAFQRQRMFIVIRERIKYYPALGQPFNGRRFPFQRVEFGERDTVTPDLDQPDPINLKRILYNFWPAVNGHCYFFRFTGWDEQGPKHLSAPLIFVDNIVAHNPNYLKPVIDEYLSIEPPTPIPPTLTPAPSPTPAYRCPEATRTIFVAGQPIAYGPSRRSGDTGYPTENLRLTVDLPFYTPELIEQFRSSDQPPFYPAVELAAIHVPAIEEFTSEVTVRDIQYPRVYLERGFDPGANAAEVFAEVMTEPDALRATQYRAPLFLTFGGPAGNNGDRSGGLSTPNQKVIAMSRRIGLVGGSSSNGNGSSVPTASAQPTPAGAAALAPPPALNSDNTNAALEKILNGKFDPLDFFGGAISEAKLLGVVKLSEIVKVVLEQVVDNLGDAPQLVRNTLYNAQAAAKPLMQQLINGIGQIDTFLQSAPDELKQRLQPPWEDVRKAVKELSNALAKLDSDPEKGAIEAIAAQAHAVQAIKRLLEEAKRLATDPLGALGLDPTVLKQKLESMIGLIGPLLGLPEIRQKIQTEIQNALARLIDALNDATSNLTAEGKDYLSQVREEVQLTKDRLNKTLVELESELTNLSNLARRNFEQIIALSSQFNKEVSNLRTQYQQLVNAVESKATTIAAELNQLLQLKVVETLLGATPEAKARELALKFQQSRKELEDKWNALQPEVRARMQQVYSDVQARFREVQDFPDSLQNKGRTLLDDYTNRINIRWLDTQREYLLILNSFHDELTNIKSPNVAALTADPSIADLQAKLVELGQAYTVVGKFFADPTAAQTLIQNVANKLVGQLKDDLLKLGQELVNLAKGPFLANAVQVNDKLNLLRDRATYAFVLAGAAAGNAIQSFQAAHAALLANITTYEGQIKEAARVLREELERFESNVPPILKPAVAGLLSGLIASLKDFQDGRKKLEQLPTLLQDVLQLRDRVVNLITNPVDQLPALLDLQKRTDEFLKQFGIPVRIALSFDWKPPLKNPDWKIFEIDANNEKTDFVIRADAIIDVLHPAPPAFNITGILTNFKLNLLPDPQFIIITFTRLEFKSVSGGPLQVNAKIHKIDFGEALGFVKELAEILNPSSGPFLDIQPSGITAGFRFGWPMIPVGTMIMYGLNLYAGITLPFDGSPMRLRLGVSDRARPFLLAVGVYAGGGFLGIELDASGIQKVEGALEFGAHVELDFFGVAKGHGSVMGGFYFSSDRKYKPSGESYTQTTLCGFVRASGELSILGLITQSLDIHVEVCYQSHPDRVYGRATVTIEIHMLFFSVSVGVTAEYTFYGSEGSSHHHHVSTTAQKSLPGADDNGATRKPIYADAFRWEDFLPAFHN